MSNLKITPEFSGKTRIDRKDISKILSGVKGENDKELSFGEMNKIIAKSTIEEVRKFRQGFSYKKMDKNTLERVVEALHESGDIKITPRMQDKINNEIKSRIPSKQESPALPKKTSRWSMGGILDRSSVSNNSSNSSVGPTPSLPQTPSSPAQPPAQHINLQPDPKLPN